MNSNWSYSPETINSGPNRRFLFLCDLEIWWMTLKDNRTHLLCHFKLCASFHGLLWVQNRVTVRKRPMWVKIGDFLSPVTLEFDGWPWKTIGHLFNATSSFVHHFMAICEFKMELQYGSGQCGSKSVIFFPYGLEIGRMTLKDNRAPLQWYFKLFASLHGHLRIQTGVTVRKRPIWVRIYDFISRVTLKFDRWP